MLTKGKYQYSYHKTCEVCGRRFFPSHHRNRCCSRKCGCAIRSGPRRTNRTKIKCNQCGRIIYRSAYKLAQWGLHFCSTACKGEWNSRNNRGAANPNYRNAGLRTCQSCGRQFQNYNKLRKFCSIHCTHAHSREHPLYAAAIGDKYEMLCAQELAKAGWYVAKSKASRGPWDLFAMNGKGFLLVQVKKTSGYRPNPKTYAALSNLAVPPGTKKQIWINNRHGIWEVGDL